VRTILPVRHRLGATDCVLETAAKQWPALTFILEYEEGGMGFKGLARFQGEQHEDHCIEA